MGRGSAERDVASYAARTPLIGDVMRVNAALGVPFDEAMLSWPAGPKSFDGAWAPHWYDAVHRSTGFEAAEGPLPDVPADYAEMIAEALRPYERLKAKSLTLS